MNTHIPLAPDNSVEISLETVQIFHLEMRSLSKTTH